MAKVLLVTSLKGGVGKSTVAAGISAALALSGKRTLALDLDFAVRSLELILGLEGKTVFNSLDVLEGRCSLERAVVAHGELDGLYLLAAPRLDTRELDFGKLFDSLGDFSPDGKALDYIIVDAQARDTEIIRAVSRHLDAALVPCSHSPSSVRAAEQTGEFLRECGVNETKLIVNGFDPDGVIRGGRMSLTELIDSTGLMLTGVVPYDRELELCSDSGETIGTLPKSSNTRRAFMNIAARLDGGQSPLFDGFAGNVYKKILQKQ